MTIADLIKGRPEDVGRIVRELGLSRYLELNKLRQTKENFWPEYDRVLDILYEVLVEGHSHLIPDIETSKLYPATHALYDVVNSDLVHIPIRPRKENDEKRTIAGLGRTWQVCLFDGENILSPGDLVLIDSGRPFGKGEYKAEIIGEGTFNPHGEKNWANESLLELDIRDVIKKFGHKDAEGKDVKEGDLGYHTCKVGKKQPKKVATPEKAG